MVLWYRMAFDSFGYKGNRGEFRSLPPVDGDPEIYYLNLDIINNNRNDGTAPDQPIRFIEARDAPILKNASKYQFSIIRFAMNGPNLDLPLFIPVVKVNQADPNVTEYECAISYEQTWATTNQPNGITIRAIPPTTPLIYISETQNPVFAPTPRPPNVSGQDISTRYYWVYTYQHFVDLVNNTLATAHLNCYNEFVNAWTAANTGDAVPYATYQDFVDVVGKPPFMEVDDPTNIFSIIADTRAFGQTVPAFTPTATELTAPSLRLFFDTNMFGLFANFSNTFYGGPSSKYQGPFGPNVATPVGYVNEILFPNDFYKNILDYKTNPPAYVPVADQQYYWITKQEFTSTSSLWSPIGSIVFTTTLLPIRSEGVGQPVVFGDNNLGYDTASIQNAWSPIITDISLDQSFLGAKDYRTAIYYSPTAEYRMASLTSSEQPISAIDIQVFWKNRLDGTLTPIGIPNLGSVSIKCMFRRIRD